MTTETITNFRTTAAELKASGMALEALRIGMAAIARKAADERDRTTNPDWEAVYDATLELTQDEELQAVRRMTAKREAYNAAVDAYSAEDDADCDAADIAVR